MKQGWRHWFWKWRGVALATPSATLIVLLLRLGGLLQGWEWRAYDQYLRWRPVQPDQRIAIVGIDEGDIHALGQSILPDAIYAEVITKLAAQSPRAIGLDIYRDVPVEPGHAELQKVFTETEQLVGIRKAAGTAGRDTVAAAPLLESLGKVGINDVLADADNTVRRGLLLVNTDDGTQLPSFALFLALLYLEPEGITPEMVGETDQWQLGKTLFQPFEANDGGYIRANAAGYQTLINYRGGSQLFETVPLRDVLNDRLPPDWGRDRIILIGPVGESFKDTFFTPHSSNLLSLPQPMAGVEIHANLTSQIISAALNKRSLIRSWPEVAEMAWILAWAMTGALLSWTQRNPGHHLPIRLAASIIGAALILVASTYGLFLMGWWVPTIPPLLALLGATGGITAYMAHSANQIRQTFGRYLSDQVVANLLEDPDNLKLGGENRVITILTSDLRGFTAMSDQLRPEQVVEILNLYLGYMSDVVNRFEGTIDEFLGDGILIIFGAPNQQADAPERAVACAIAMQQVMPEVNKIMRERGFPEQSMGIGINTGEVVVGNIGSESRTKYSVIGSAVNLAFRVESYTTGGQILVSEETCRRIEIPLTTQGETEVHPKGIKRPLTIYDVIGIGGPYNLALTPTEDIRTHLTHPMPIEYATLSGKQVGKEQYSGYLLELSEKTALLKTEASEPLSPLTNLKLIVQAPQAPTDIKQADIYAKVQKVTDTDHYLIVFTARPPTVITWMESQLTQI